MSAAERAQRLSDYRALLAKVSAKFDEIHARNSERMQCRRGCSACCAPELSVFTVERENILAHIEESASKNELLALEKANPHGGTRCQFLSAKGDCAIYEARPVICRSHGAPIFAKSESGAAMRDVCPLNFDELVDLSELPAEDFINLDLLNRLLAIIDSAYGGRGERFPLKPSGILGPQKK